MNAQTSKYNVNSFFFIRVYGKYHGFIFLHVISSLSCSCVLVWSRWSALRRSFDSLLASAFLLTQVHIERVHLKVKQHCSFCEKKYSDVKNLLKHMEKQHNLKDPAVHQSYQQLRFDRRYRHYFCLAPTTS